MKINGVGNIGYTESELADSLRTNPESIIDSVSVIDPQLYNQAIQDMYSDFVPLEQWIDLPYQSDYHDILKSQWHLPQEYADINIIELLLDRCDNDDELQRMGQELLLFNEYGLYPLLHYLHYLVETFEKNDVVMGVGRGSSVASFALYKLGVHRVNSLYYDLDIHEFIRN